MARNPHRRSLLTLLGGWLLLAVFIIALPAGATSGDMTLRAVTVTNCAQDSLIFMAVEIKVSGGSHNFVWKVLNNARNTTSGSGKLWTQGSGTFDIQGYIPAGTQPGDSLTLTLALTSTAGVAYDSAVITFNCAAGTVYAAPDLPPPTPTPDPNATPGPTSTPGGPTPTGSGVPPLGAQGWCGIFGLNGWEHRVVVFSDFPGCAPYAPEITVACLTEFGTWTQRNILNLIYSPDGRLLEFDVVQHGHCGLFPIAIGVPGL